MSDLRLIGRSDDGSTLELQSPDGTSYTLGISDHLRSLVNQPKLFAVTQQDDQQGVTVRDIQARLRSGESIDSIARSTDWSPEKIDKFSGPIMQERAYIIGWR
ncbi:MAG: septation protein SepH [Actinomycetota bacterium]